MFAEILWIKTSSSASVSSAQAQEMNWYIISYCTYKPVIRELKFSQFICHVYLSALQDEDCRHTLLCKVHISPFILLYLV